LRRKGKKKMEEAHINTELENKNEMSLAKAREILHDETITDEKLNMIIDSVNIFCRISYELFSQQQEQTEKIESEKTISLQEPLLPAA